MTLSELLSTSNPKSTTGISLLCYADWDAVRVMTVTPIVVFEVDFQGLEINEELQVETAATSMYHPSQCEMVAARLIEYTSVKSSSYIIVGLNSRVICK